MTNSPRHATASERDWAFAKQQLDSGADPANVIRELAGRRDDKPNPHAYAQRTVRLAARERSGDAPPQSKLERHLVAGLHRLAEVADKHRSISELKEIEADLILAEVELDRYAAECADLEAQRWEISRDRDDITADRRALDADRSAGLKRDMVSLQFAEAERKAIDAALAQHEAGARQIAGVLKEVRSARKDLAAAAKRLQEAVPASAGITPAADDA